VIEQRAAPEHEVRVADHDAGEIHGEEAAAAERGGKAVGEQAGGRRHDGVQSCRLEIRAVDQADRELADPEADHAAHAHLHDEQPQQAETGLLPAGDQLETRDGQEDRHRIVRSALDLQDRREPLADVHAARAQHIENGRRVRRADDAAEQQCGEWRQAEQPVRGERGDARGEQDADGRKRKRGRERDAERRHRRAHAAIEQDHRQRQRADAVRDPVILEGDAADAVGARQHADADEQHEHGKPDPRRELARENADDQEDRGNQQKTVYGEQVTSRAGCAAS
jgi:hypothetical protein